MATMRYEIFDAFRAAGVPDDKARAAAEAMAEDNLATKGDIERLDRQLIVIKWMIGLVIAVQIVPLLRHLL